MEATEMVPGSWYEITYQVPGLHKKPRRMRCQFLGLERKLGNVWVEASVSLRPKAGTSSVDLRHIKSISQATTESPILPKVVAA